MVNKDQELDEQLAAYGAALQCAEPPSDLKQKILAEAAARSAEGPKLSTANTTPNLSPSVWNLSGLAAAIGVFALSILFGAQLLGPEKEQVNDTLLLAKNHVSYPVRVHSLARGAEWRHIPSHIVKDQRGRTRLVVVNSARRNL